MEQKLKLYKYDNGELVSFPSKESQIEIGVFTYTAKRMGDAPTITATINYKECLDNLWTGKECVIFNDEFFYVKNIPTSSYSNTDSRYKHECTFVNERSKLNGVLFTDVVDDKASDGKPVSNSSKFSFNGNITEFVARLNASLRYAKLQTIENSLVYGYHVVIDEGTKAIENFNDTFNVSFEDKTISEAIQEIYNSYNIPYYFEGKTVHVGLIDDEHDLLSDIDGGFKYGVNNELISISKSNKNNKIINRITALGSSENIPYYYPNETEKGSVAVTEYGKDTTPSYVELFNPFLFAKRIGKDDKIHYLKGNASWSTGVTIYEGDDSLDFKSVSFDESVKVKCKREDGSLQDASNIKICFSIHVKNEKDYFRINPSIAIDNTQFSSDYEYSFNKDLVIDAYLSNERGRIELEASDEGFNTVEIPVGSYQLWITYKVSHRAPKWDGKGSSPIVDKNVKVKLEVFNSYEKFWFLNDSTTRYNLEDFGLRLTGGVSPYNGMAFAQKVTIPYYPISQNLILPIYRSTQGEERFYNAYNATYKDENGNYYDFKNEYAEDSISEHIVKFDDIKPTIKGVEYNGRRIDKFVEFAYDKSDNDLKQVVEDKEEYQHPYFFAKLPPLGFNLFDHALETGEMTISMTSGHCAGCSFTIMVNDANKNTVQVDEDGNLKYDEGGYVLVGSVNGQGNQSPIDSQNDTTNNSVWIALKKDIDSFGTILPSSNIKPSSNDTFVITNILLPQEYIEAAEERLKNEAIKYMAENNSSKFSFSIKFSRIFLAENPTIFDKISENSRIAVNYNGSIYPLHVSSYSYKMSEGALLPEIDVSLTDSVVISTNAIESAVSEAKADVLTYVDRYATLEEATTIFIRKDKEDYSPSPMVYGRSLTVNESHKVGENLDVAKNATIGEKTTTKAIQVGEQASVGNYVEGVSGIVMKIDSDGSSYMELDRLKVRMKAYFDELEVQKVNTVGGKMIMSPAGSFTCGAVLTSEELIANGEDVDTTNGSFYRCFFNAVQDDEQIENKFIVGDFAFSQSFNLTGRSSNKMYWREVVGVSSTYVDLSYDKCALDSDIPSSGDIICQLGSKVKDRQNAIVMTTVDEYAPAITLHYGIDKFSLSGTEIIQYGVRDGKAFFNSYGDMFLGDKPVEGVSNAYMKYTTESGLEIKGKLTVGSTYNDKELGELFDAQQESLEKFKTSVTKEFENIRNEMDGAIDTWFGEETPTLENKPASDWLTNTDKDSHLGDLYYSNDGKAYRFQYTETEGYCWATIEDSEVVKALELAQKALDTADGKRTIFIEQPKPPYQVGDLWAAGENQPLKRCIKSREDILESFYESDWDLADNSQAYADAIKDELQKSIKSTEDSLNKAIEDAEKEAKDYTDEGKTALQKSIDELNGAKANVADVYTKALVYTKEEANNEITRAEAVAIAAAKQQADAAIKLSEETTKAYADGIVTKEEKERIKQAEENLEAAKTYAEKKANEAFNNANSEIEKFDYLKAALKESTDIDGGLIQTSLIKLGYTNAEGKHQVMSGTNGIADSSLIGGGIATWWGGEMHDLLDYYTWDNEWVAKENVTIPSNIPSGLIRFDGTGYFAKGNIWWDETGNLHADPLSFFVGEDSVGALLASFQVVNDKDGKIDYLIPKAPFSTLTVGELRIKDENGRFVTLKFKDGVLLSDESFASEKSVSAKGVGQSGGSGSVSYDRLDTWEGYTSEKAGYVLSAALGWDLKTMIENLDLGDFDLSGYLSKEEASKTYATQKSLSGYQPLIDASNKLAYSLISGTPTKLSDFTDDVVNGKYQPLISSTNKLAYSLLDGTPTALKNPNALKFGNKSYDGSEEKIITAADLGAFTEHQAIYALTVKDSAGTTKLTYTPNDKASEITLTKAMVGLGDVENTKLSAWAGTSKITTVGTITTGTWNAKKIANDYIVNPYITIAGNKVNLGETLSVDTLQTSLDIVTKNDEQTISGVKTFSSAIKANGGIEIPKGKTIKFGDGIISWDDTNNAFKFHNPVYSTSSISAKGIGTGGSGGGGGVDVDWNNFPSSIIPSNSTYDLGSNAKPWDRVFASYFGTDNKITYIAGKSITLNSELYFSNGIDHIDTDGNAYLNGIQAVSVEAESITLNGNNVATIGDIDSKLSGYAKVNVAQKFTGTQTFASIEIESALSNIVPDNDDTYDLGGKDNRWSGVYATLIIADEVKIADEYAATEGYVTRKLNAIDIHNYIPDVLRAKNIIPASEDYSPDQTMSSYSLGGAANADRWNTVFAHLIDGKEAKIGKIYNTAKDDVSIDIEDEDIIITAGGIIQLKGEVIVGNAYKDDNLVATRGWIKEQGYGSGSADLSNYYTKEQVNSYVSGLEAGISTVDAKFANYYNKESVHSYVSQEINTFSEENLGTAALYGVTTSVTSGSNSLVTSGAVASALNGYLPSRGGTINSSIEQALALHRTADNGGIGIKFSGGGKQAWVGFEPQDYGHGAYIYTNGHYLWLASDGVAKLDSNTLIHSGNIGSQSVNEAKSLKSFTVFPFDATASTYRKIATIELFSRYTGKTADLKISLCLSTYDRGNSCDVHVMCYQQQPLGSLPQYSIETNCDDRFFKIYGVLNTSSTSSTLDLYVYGLGWTYNQLYVSVIRGDDIINIDSSNVDSLPSGTVITPSKMGSVYSASKLTTPRTIWGQSFDGTGDVSGSLTMPVNTAIKVTDTNSKQLTALQLNPENALLFGQFTAKEGYETVIYGNTITLAYGNYGLLSYSALVVNSSGNVTIGSSDLAGASNKLYVNGNSYVNGTLNVGNESSASIALYRKSANYIWAVNSGGYLVLGVQDVGYSGPQYASLMITGSSVTPGARSNAVSLGSDSYRWSGVYSVNGNFSGSLTVSGGIKMPYNDGDSTALYTEGMSTILGYSPRVGNSTTKIVGTKVLVDSNLEVTGSLSVSGSTLASQSWVNSSSTPATLLGNLVNQNVGLTSGYINEFKADTIDLGGSTVATTDDLDEYAKKATTLAGYGITDALPLIGGELHGILTIKPTNISGGQDGIILHDSGSGDNEMLRIKWTSSKYTGIDISPNYNYSNLTFCDGTTRHNLIHSGNIGSQSVRYATSAGDADTLDGVQLNDVAKHIFGTGTYKCLPSGSDLNSIDFGVWGTLDNTSYTNAPQNNFGLIQVGLNTSYRGQLLLGYGSKPSIRYRASFWKDSVEIWSYWRALAFTDSNVASADKLSTARTIWGQSFDGSGDVSGVMTGVNTIHFGSQTYPNKGIFQGNWYAEGWTDEDIVFYFNKAHFSGNVLIGTTTDYGHKLYVNGNSYVNGYFVAQDIIEARKGLEVSKTIRGIADNDDEVWSIDNTGAASFASLKVGNVSVAIQGQGNNFVFASNEITLIPSKYSGHVWLNYRTVTGTDGNLTYYNLGNGAGGYAGLIASEVKIVNGTSSQFLKADGSLDSTAYLPLSGGIMSNNAYIAWNSGSEGNDVSDWNTITGNGLRIISSITKTANAPTQYATALHVKGRYRFAIASEGGEADAFYIRNSNREWKTLMHSGNIGSQSVASATRARYVETQNYTGAGWYGDSYKLYAKWFNGTICDWKSTDDANNEYKVRVDIAKKLDTARTIWGQSFDGSGDVSGHIVLGNKGIYGENGKNALVLSDNTISLGYGYRTGNVDIYGGNTVFRAGETSKISMRINSNCNITLGASDWAGSTYKLYVNGDSYVNGSLTVSGTSSFNDSVYINNGDLCGYEDDVQNWIISPDGSADFKSVNIAGKTAATQAWVQEQGYLANGISSFKVGTYDGLNVAGTYLGAGSIVVKETTPSIKFLVKNYTSDHTSIIEEATANVLNINGQMYIKKGGNVAVGTSTINNSYKLYVEGKTYFKGDSYVSGTLTSTGEGTFKGARIGDGNLTGGYDGSTIWSISAEGVASFKSLTVNGVAITGSGGGSFNGGTVANSTMFAGDFYIKGERNYSYAMRKVNAYRIDFGYDQEYISLRGYNGQDATWTIDSENGSADFNDSVTASSFEQASDINIKNILGDTRLSLGTMANAPLVQFDWKNKPNSKHHIGTIAQYWDSCLPEVVSRTKNNTLALSYGELGVAMGISLAKEMTEMLTRMDNTDSEVDKLKKRISELEKEIENLKAE